MPRESIIPMYTYQLRYLIRLSPQVLKTWFVLPGTSPVTSADNQLPADLFQKTLSSISRNWTKRESWLTNQNSYNYPQIVLRGGAN